MSRLPCGALAGVWDDGIGILSTLLPLSLHMIASVPMRMENNTVHNSSQLHIFSVLVSGASCIWNGCLDGSIVSQSSRCSLKRINFIVVEEKRKKKDNNNDKSNQQTTTTMKPQASIFFLLDLRLPLLLLLLLLGGGRGRGGGRSGGTQLRTKALNHGVGDAGTTQLSPFRERQAATWAAPGDGTLGLGY